MFPDQLLIFWEFLCSFLRSILDANMLYSQCLHFEWSCLFMEIPNEHMGHANIHGMHPNTWGHPNIFRCLASRHMGAYKCIGDIWTPLSLTKHSFFVLYMYSRHPNIIQTYGGVQTYGRYPNIQEASKHMWGCSNIWGHHNTQGASKHTGGIQTYGGIQMY